GQATDAHVLTAAPDGTIFASGFGGLWAVVTRGGRPSKVIQVSAKMFSKVLVDRDGGLFAWDLERGFHIGDARRLLEPGGESVLLSDTFTLKQQKGLSPPLVNTMKEDSEGNVWLASSTTLERFSNSPFTSVWLPGKAFTFGLVPGEDGAVWAANWDTH